jgi:hypothetical protein
MRQQFMAKQHCVPVVRCVIALGATIAAGCAQDARSSASPDVSPAPAPSQLPEVSGPPPLGGHALALYSDREAESFLDAMRKDRAAGEKPPATLREALSRYGIDARRLGHGGRYTGNASEWQRFKLSDRYDLVARYRLDARAPNPLAEGLDAVWIERVTPQQQSP